MRRGLMIAAGCCLATVAVVQAGALAAPHAHARPARSDGVAIVVARLAAAASAHPLPFLQGSQFLYVQSRVSQGVVFARHRDLFELPGQLYPARPQATVVSSQGSWTSPDRRGLATFRRLAVHFLTAAGRRAWVRIGRPRLASASGSQSSGPSGYVLGTGRFTRQQMLAVSRDPATLYRRYFRVGGDPLETLLVMADQLELHSVPNAVRVTLIRALALVPGVRAVASASDGLGRRGVGLEVNESCPSTSSCRVLDRWDPTGRDLELIFDPSTGALLGSREFALDGFSFSHGLVLPINVSDVFAQPVITNAAGVD